MEFSWHLPGAVVDPSRHHLPRTAAQMTILAIKLHANWSLMGPSQILGYGIFAPIENHISISLMPWGPIWPRFSHCINVFRTILALKFTEVCPAQSILAFWGLGGFLVIDFPVCYWNRSTFHHNIGPFWSWIWAFQILSILLSTPSTLHFPLLVLLNIQPSGKKISGFPPAQRLTAHWKPQGFLGIDLPYWCWNQNTFVHITGLTKRNWQCFVPGIINPLGHHKALPWAPQDISLPLTCPFTKIRRIIQTPNCTSVVKLSPSIQWDMFF